MVLRLISIFLTCFAWANSVCANDDTVRDVRFESGGVTISGSIVLPASGQASAAIVFVHGSGPQKRSMRWAEAFAKKGIAALVYDKRGVGESGGKYESRQSVSGPNIQILADDAAAALQTLKAQPELRDVPVGLTGISQAGWIVPLAATAVAPDFLVLWSGPVCKVSEEDIYSKYTNDLDGKSVPPYQEALDSRFLPYVWPSFLGVDTDPSDSLRKFNMPGLWVFGARDGSIPVDLSVERLETLKKLDKPYDHKVFPDLGHNNIPETMEFVTNWIETLPR